jgi:hypothetical protein
MSKARLVVGSMGLWMMSMPLLAGQAAVGYGAAAASSATSVSGVSKVSIGINKGLGSKTVVVRGAQPAGPGVKAVCRKSARVKRVEPATTGKTNGATLRPLVGGFTVIGAEPKETHDPQ